MRSDRCTLQSRALQLYRFEPRQIGIRVRRAVSKIWGDGYLYITFFIINRFIFHQIICRILANTLQHSPIVLCECVCVYCIQYSLLEYTESWLVLQRDSFLEMLLSGFSSICSSVSEIFYCFWTLLVAIKYHLY